MYNEACVLQTAVMLSEISIIAGSKEILSVHHFTVLVISPMRYAPAFSSHRYFAHTIYSRIFQSYSRRPCDMLPLFPVLVNSPMRSAPAFSSPIHRGHAICSCIF